MSGGESVPRRAPGGEPLLGGSGRPGGFSPSQPPRPQRFTLLLEAGRDTFNWRSPEYRLKILLKQLLRQGNFRCIDVRETPAAPQGTTPPAKPSPNRSES